MLLCFGYRVKHVYHKIDEIDYSKYLGLEWRKNNFKGNRVSTIVSNHCGILDIFAFASGQSSSFTPSAHVKTFPCICGLGKFYCDVTQCVYCDRGATQETRDNTVEAIVQRQESAEADEVFDWPPVVIFAEGGVTNGKNLSRFRRGAFSSLKAVNPCYMEI